MFAFRRLGPAVVAAALLGALAVPAAQAEPSPPVPALHWTACAGTFQCATAQVPVDYDQPLGATTTVALTRLPASDPAHRIGSLFVNPGGPGGSGVEIVQGLATFLYPASVRARFDIVGFDPRGVVDSHPVLCFGSQAKDDAFWGAVPAIPVGRTQVQAEIGQYLRLDAGCAQRTGSWLQHISTADTARDLDLLRQAVGDRGLTYDGVSYGSYLGQTYAALFPQHVRALVIDGIVDPQAFVHAQPGEMAEGIWGRGGYAAATADAFRVFLAGCAAAPTACPFATGPLPLQQKWQQLLTELKASPVVLNDGEGGTIDFTYSYTVAYALGLLYLPGFGYYPLLGKVLQLLWQGEHGAATTTALPLRLRPPELGYENGLDAQTAIACNDTDNPRDAFAVARSAAASQALVPDFGPAWAYMSLPCTTWPAQAADRYTGPWNPRTAAPVLVVGNTHDAATPYANAVKVASLLPRARLLTLDAVGHTSWFAPSACVRAATAAYWIDGQLPAAGTVCTPDSSPFATATSAAAVPLRAPAL